MTNAEAVNWLINITADIGKAEHSDLWHYEQALSEIREMLEDAQPETHDKRTETHACDLISRQDVIDALLPLYQEHRYKIPGKRETYSQYNEAWQDALSRAEGAIFDIPSAQQYDIARDIATIIENEQDMRVVLNQPRWISVSERLPEEDVEVLITYRYKEGEGNTSHAYIDITTYGQMYFGGNKVGDHKHWRQPFEYFTSNYEVVAWMPLPEPYKGE